MGQILLYRSGYKYQTQWDYSCETGVIPPYGRFIGHEYFTLNERGTLWVKQGYAWDGASGPAVDTRNFIVPSLVHDVFYQMMREGLLPQEYRKSVDELLRKMCHDRGMNGFRSWYVLKAVRWFGKGAATKAKEVLEAI